MNQKDINLGYLEGAVSVVLNTALFALKFWVGLSTGSIAMMADAWHTLSDTLTSVVVILGFWIAGKPKDAKHPFGHGRAELIGALIIGILLGLVGAVFLKESIDILVRKEQPPVFTAFAIGVFAVSAVLKEALATFSIWAGNKINSQSLIGDGWHHRSDALASLAIVLGAVFGSSLWWLDAVMGIGVSFLIIWVAYDVVKKAARDLMGAGPDDKLVAEIKEVIKTCAPGVSLMHHLHFHRYGDHREITLHVHMAGDASLRLAHEIASMIESQLRKELGVESTVHMEPCPDCNPGDNLRLY